ncbi:MAG: TetR/AcrR family transcriptional regulator [Bacteroidales bacterium]
METTREKIINEAFKLFLKRGYNGVSMNDLVKSSGLSKGAFYHYFASKEELFCETVTNSFFAAMGDMSFKSSATATLEENLIALIRFKADIFKKMQKRTGIKSLDSGYFTLIFDGINRSPAFRKALTFAGSEEQQLLKKIFKQAKHNGELATSLKAGELALIYSSMLDGMELHAVVEGTLDKLHEKETEATINFCRILSRNQ